MTIWLRKNVIWKEITHVHTHVTRMWKCKKLIFSPWSQAHCYAFIITQKLFPTFTLPIFYARKIYSTNARILFAQTLLLELISHSFLIPLLLISFEKEKQWLLSRRKMHYIIYVLFEKEAGWDRVGVWILV